MKTYPFLSVAFLGILFLLVSCENKPVKRSSEFPLLTVTHFAKAGFTKVGNMFFKSFGASYLENTSQIQYADVKKLQSWKDKVYMLAGDSLMRFNLEGKMEILYHTPEEGFQGTFDIDTLNQCMYVLGKNNKTLYKYSITDSNHTQIFPLPEEVWDNMACLSGQALLLTTRAYPNPVYYIMDPNSGTLKKHEKYLVEGIQNKIFPDTLRLSANLIGYSPKGVLYKGLLDDTVYIWKDKTFTPYCVCDMEGEGIAYQKGGIFRKEALFKDNKRMALAGLDFVGEFCFMKYRERFNTKGVEYYSPYLHLLHPNLTEAEKEGMDIIMHVNKLTVELQPRFPYYPNKECSRIFQIYNKEKAIEAKTAKVLNHMENHPNPKDLILNYLSF